MLCACSGHTSGLFIGIYKHCRLIVSWKDTFFANELPRTDAVLVHTGCGMCDEITCCNFR